MISSIQIPLDFKFRDEISMSRFYVGQNKNILNHINQQVESILELKPEDRFLFLWGESGCGKSHLLQAISKELHESGKSVSYFSCNNTSDIKPEMLEGLEQCDLIAIDDVQAIAGDSQWELALFSFIRKWHESGGLLLVSSESKPADISISLPDLKTRLSGWPVVYQLQTLPDEKKLKVLQDYATTRGLELNQEVGRFILTRFPRNLKLMLDLLEKVDVEAMAQQRRLTIPFLKTLI